MSKVDVPKKLAVPRFNEEKDSVVLSGTLDEVATLFKKIAKLKYPNWSEKDVDAEALMMKAGVINTRGFSDGYQWTPGVTERIKVFKDVYGEHGRRNKFVLLYFPNSPPDDRERQDTVAKIKQNMRTLGYEI